MPPRPRHPRISSCGKCGAIASGGSGTVGTAPESPDTTVSVFRFRAMRQLGHNPAGAFSSSGAPHCGHFELLLIPDTYRSANDCYMKVLLLFPGQGSGKMAQFPVQISAIRQGLGYFIAINFAKPL